MSAPLIEFDDVHRRLGGHDVLAGVDFRVNRGETVALVGVNGAGKSTLIKLLLDLRAPDRGSIRIGGRPQTDRHVRGCLTYLPERFHPPYYLRGLQYLDYMARLYHRPRERAEQTAMAQQLGLDEPDLDRLVQTYSKGMAQMLGLAACLLSGRELLVLDEPMSGLDPSARRRLQQTLAGTRDQGRTIFFTTHLMQDAEALADRVLLLHDGRIVADTPPADLAADHHGDLEAAFVALVEGQSADGGLQMAGKAG